VIAWPLLLLSSSILVFQKLCSSMLNTRSSSHETVTIQWNDCFDNITKYFQFLIEIIFK
jgi:hypothetical protein